MIYESPQMAVMYYNIHKYDAIKITKAFTSAIFSFSYTQKISLGALYKEDVQTLLIVQR